MLFFDDVELDDPENPRAVYLVDELARKKYVLSRTPVLGTESSTYGNNVYVLDHPERYDWRKQDATKAEADALIKKISDYLNLVEENKYRV